MEKLFTGTSELESSRLVYGCMRIAGDQSDHAVKIGKRAVLSAIEEGYNHFDHADIYGGGKSEEIFGEILRDTPDLRDNLIITSKCGIRRKGEPNESDPGRYDFSKEYIINCVEGSLARLKTDYLDILLLHRPDYLGDPVEIIEAFTELNISGKVLYFGVSNFHPSQVNLLQEYSPFPLIINQIEINIHNISSLDNGTLDLCMQKRISPQAWCPLGGVVYPAWGNTFSTEDEKRIKSEFQYQADKYQTEPWIIMLAWLLKHPSDIFPIIGSTKPERIRQAKDALEINYSREDWYRLLVARNGSPMP